MSDKKFITLERLQSLQESINYLDNYKIDYNVDVHIGPNINTINVKETNLLSELGQINIRREEIINKLCQIKHYQKLKNTMDY